MKRIFAALALLVASTLAAHARCTDRMLSDVRTNMLYCRDACAADPFRVAECRGSDRMKEFSEKGDPNGVREGFEICHYRSPVLKAQAGACHDERAREFLNSARWVYGYPPLSRKRYREIVRRDR